MYIYGISKVTFSYMKLVDTNVLHVKERNQHYEKVNKKDH